MTSDRFGIDDAYVARGGIARKVVKRSAIVVGFFVVIAIASSLIDHLFNPQTDGPTGSSYVTTEVGFGAWHDVLVDLGRPVERLRKPLTEEPMASGSTLIVARPTTPPDDGYVDALRRHAESGGRVIIVGSPELEEQLGLGDTLPEAFAGTSTVASTVEDVERLELGGRAFAEASGALVETADAVVVAAFPEGDGDIVVVADPFLFANVNLGLADNGILAVRLVGDAPVVFDEYVHGFGTAEGVGGLGAGLIRFSIVGAIAGLIAMWAVAVRIGPPEQSERALPPARGEYIEALGATLARAGDVRAFEAVRQRALGTLDRVGRSAGSSDHARLRQHAGALVGLTKVEVHHLLKHPENRADAAEMARIAAKIERALERTSP